MINEKVPASWRYHGQITALAFFERLKLITTYVPIFGTSEFAVHAKNILCVKYLFF